MEQWDEFDYSDYPYLNDIKGLPIWEIVVKAVFYGIVIILSLIGNTLVILVIFRHRWMRTTTNYYLVNLAVADLMVTVSCTWVHLVDDVTEGWVLGSFFCTFNSFAHVVSLVASVLSLTLIAYDRFFGIVFAMKAHMSERKAKTSLLIIWLISSLVGSPILMYRRLKERQWADHTEQWCDDEWPVYVYYDNNATVTTMPLRKAYYTSVTVVLYFIPMLIMIVAYSVIIWTLKTQTTPGEHVPGGNRNQQKARRKVLIMLISIVIVFAICWLPTQICLLYTEHRTQRTSLDDWYFKLDFCARYLAYSNSAVNPILYAGFNENFKRGLWSFLGCSSVKAQSKTNLCDGKSYGTYYYSTGAASTTVTSAVTAV